MCIFGHHHPHHPILLVANHRAGSQLKILVVFRATIWLIFFVEIFWKIPQKFSFLFLRLHQRYFSLQNDSKCCALNRNILITSNLNEEKVEMIQQGTRKTFKTFTLSFTPSRHAEQLLFSCLCSSLSVYSRKLQYFFWTSSSPSPYPVSLEFIELIPS